MSRPGVRRKTRDREVPELRGEEGLTVTDLPERDPKERLKFLVRLANSRPESDPVTRPAAWAALMERIRRYIIVDGSGLDELQQAKTDGAIVAEAVRVLRELFEAVLARRASSWITLASVEICLDARAQPPMPWWSAKTIGEQIMLAAAGSDFHSPLARRLGRCQRPAHLDMPACTRFFFGRVGQTFCSRACWATAEQVRAESDSVGETTTATRRRARSRRARGR